MNLPEKIKTIENRSEFKFKEKGSLFFAICQPVLNEKESLQFLSEIKKQYYDATHHCYSYKFQNSAFKYSDDGEPSGTAGIRIFNAQNHFSVTNLISIVIRYYGGTKLGVGPLGKAYYDSIFECLKKTTILEKELYNKIEITYDFDLSNTVHHFASKYQLIIVKNDFEKKPKMTCLLRHTIFEMFSKDLLSASQNKLQIYLLNEFTYLTSNFI